MPLGRSPRAATWYLLLGAAVGGIYALANTELDELARRGPLEPAWSALHAIIDRGIPLIVGALLGLALHYLGVRAELGRVEARRAEDLAERLRGLERDQAAWVVAAATLHEVKNPLHAISLLVEEIESDPSDEVRALATRMRGQIDRADASLRGLRGLAGTSRPEAREVEIDRLARALVLDLAGVADRAGVELRVDASERVVAHADPTYVRIILRNLLDNALEATHDEGKKRHLALTVGHDERGRAQVIVSDDGAGLPGDRSVFEPLSSSKPKGLGLGLAVARALARAMDGDLRPVEREGWRTSFELFLPAEAS